MNREELKALRVEIRELKRELAKLANKLANIQSEEAPLYKVLLEKEELFETELEAYFG